MVIKIPNAGNSEGLFSIWRGEKKICQEELLLGKNYLGKTPKLFFLPLTFQTVPAYYSELPFKASRCPQRCPHYSPGSLGGHIGQDLTTTPICVFVSSIDKGTECQKFVSFKVTESGKHEGALFKCRQAFMRFQ